MRIYNTVLIALVFVLFFIGSVLGLYLIMCNQELAFANTAVIALIYAFMGTPVFLFSTVFAIRAIGFFIKKYPDDKLDELMRVVEQMDFSQK